MPSSSAATATATAAIDVARYIDHTLLRPDATRTQIEQLCAQARRFGFAAVCVAPCHVRTSAAALPPQSSSSTTPVKVCTVIGFPLGANTTAVKAYETRRAVADGATEVDVVINIGAVKSGDWTAVQDDLREVVEAAHRHGRRYDDDDDNDDGRVGGGVLCKVILETSLLTDEEKKRACQACVAAGADFVKTSTGFAKGGATVQDIRLMRAAVGPDMGVKASGGVRTWQDAQAMIAAGATRIGTSAGVQIVQQQQQAASTTTTMANEEMTTQQQHVDTSDGY